MQISATPQLYQRSIFSDLDLNLRRALHDCQDRIKKRSKVRPSTASQTQFSQLLEVKLPDLAHLFSGAEAELPVLAPPLLFAPLPAPLGTMILPQVASDHSSRM